MSDDKRTQIILFTMMYTIRIRSILAPQTQNAEQLIPFEHVYNRDILDACRRIMFLVFLYLMDDSFKMRSAAF